MALDLALDCKHYLGDRPCRFRQRCHCEHFDPMGQRVLVIKLGALGDVIRTASLLPSIKQTWPRSHITWLSKPNGVRILRGHPMVDRLMAFDAEGVTALREQTFDLVLSLDKEAGPTALCNAVRSGDKRGMRMSDWGTTMPCDASCEAYFELGLDDDLKFCANRKTYPQLVHEAVRIENAGERYKLPCDAASLERARRMLEPWRAGAKAMVGLQTGAGTVFANKSLPPERWEGLARELTGRGYGVVLLGGPEEAAHNAAMAGRLGGAVHDAGCDNTEQQFTGIVGECDAVATGDTLALHVALGRGVPVVGVFGPTCEQEIDLFGLGTKVISPAECGPCYRRACDIRPSCMDRITDASVLDAIEVALKCPKQTDNL